MTDNEVETIEIVNDKTTTNRIKPQPKKPTISINHFPNDQKKFIDYVIFYKDTEETEKNVEMEKMRNKFLEQLGNEGFTMHKIVRNREHELLKEKNSKSNYLLLNCSIQRLMEEAEKINLELPLKEFDLLQKNKNSISTECFESIKRAFKLSTNHGGTFVSAPFETDIRFIFEGFSMDCDNCVGFNETTRMLLVDNILKNMSLSGDEKEDESIKGVLRSRIFAKPVIAEDSNIFSIVSNNLELKKSQNEQEEKISLTKKLTTFSGLPYMLENKYFDDAFVLHSQSRGTQQMNEIMHYMMEEESYNDIEDANIYEDSDKNKINGNDLRSKLDATWAQLKKVFQFQPLWLIRNYFGEYVSLYFAWVGTLIASLWFPVITGVIFFIVGVINSATSTNALVAANNGTLLTDLGLYGNYYLNIFVGSFDSYLTVAYAVILCLWGSIFTEAWKRESNRWVSEWGTENFEGLEQDRVQYTQKLQKYCIENQVEITEFPAYQRYLKSVVSLIVLLLMIVVVCLDIGLLIVFRIWLKSVFANDPALQSIIGDFGSSIMNSIFIMILTKVYNYIAIALNDWENPRTQTQYDDSLILKFFAFEFVNCYASFFYIAFFKSLCYSNGLFGLGRNYQEANCSTTINTTTTNIDVAPTSYNTMSLLTIQVFIILLMKPFSRFFFSVIWPSISLLYKNYTLKKYLKTAPAVKEKISEDEATITQHNDFRLFLNASIERKKEKFDTNIRDEYMEKVILYGYIMLFACSFSLGPLIFFLGILIRLRADAKQMLWTYRRPVPKKAQDIGMFHHILTFINVVAIVSNAFIVAFTSQWSVKSLVTTENRLACVVIFQNVLFLIWMLISLFPDISHTSTSLKMRQETKYVQEMIIVAKEKANKNENIISTNSTNTVIKRNTQKH